MVTLTPLEQGWQTERFAVRIRKPHGERLGPGEIPGKGRDRASRMAGQPWKRPQVNQHRPATARCVRCREVEQIASPAALAFPQAVEHLLQTGLELRDRYERGEISEHGTRTATGKLEAKLDRMLETRRRNPANRRLARHLEHELLWLFTFLCCPGLDATNNAAERAIRGMVIARKVWGGNRTWEGARTQQILVSVLRTCWQQGKDAFTRGVRLLRAPRTVILDIVPGAG